MNPQSFSSSDPLEQIRDVADRVQHLIRNVHAMLFLVAIEQFWYGYRGDSSHAQINDKN